LGVSYGSQRFSRSSYNVSRLCDDKKQRRIGKVGNQPIVVYHCEACDRLYGLDAENKEDRGEGGMSLRADQSASES
jgi:hypothetical protein